MRKLPLLLALLALATGCPKVQQKTYTFDLANNTGELRFHNISTDDASKGNDDFLQVLNDVVEGTKLETEHPGWIIDSKELVEADGKLDGLVRFHFEAPAKAGVYKHDKKSPYIFCVPGDATLLKTNGKRIDDVLAGCVAWDRKAKDLQITFKDENFDGSETSLLPQFERWKSGEKIEGGGNPFEAMMKGMTEGGDPEKMGEELGAALVGGLTSAMGLTGELTIGEPTASGGISTAQVAEALGTKTRLLLKTCFQAESMNSEVPAQSTLDFSVSPEGKASLTALSPSHDGIAACLSGVLEDDTTFPELKSAGQVSLPLSFVK